MWPRDPGVTWLCWLWSLTLFISLPSVVAISPVEVEIWSILIFNVRRRIHMIILLQSVTIQFCRLFWHISYYKVRQSNFITKFDRLLLQIASGITKCDRLLLQSASGITKCDRLYYKVRQVLQSVTVITKRDVTTCLIYSIPSIIAKSVQSIEKLLLCKLFIVKIMLWTDDYKCTSSKWPSMKKQ